MLGREIFITFNTERATLQEMFGFELPSVRIARRTVKFGLRENAGHENAGQMQHNTTHRQFTRCGYKQKALKQSNSCCARRS